MSGRELTLLLEGRVELLGRILRSSNETFLVRITRGEDSARAVYKPEAGERPLSDFEPGLYRRERAAYLLSEYLQWPPRCSAGCGASCTRGCCRTTRAAGATRGRSCDLGKTLLNRHVTASGMAGAIS